MRKLRHGELPEVLRACVLLCFGAYMPKAHFRTSWLFLRFYLGFVHQPRMAFTLTSLKEGDDKIDGDDVFPGPDPSGDARLEASPEKVQVETAFFIQKGRKTGPRSSEGIINRDPLQHRVLVSPCWSARPRNPAPEKLPLDRQPWGLPGQQEPG